MSKALTELVPRSRPRSIEDPYADPGVQRFSLITAHHPLLSPRAGRRDRPESRPCIPDHASVAHGRRGLYCRFISIARSTKARGPGRVPGPLLPFTVVGRLRLLRLDALELGPVDDALGVVGKRAGLQADDVFALDGVYHREVRRIYDELLVDYIGILPAVGVLQIDFVAVLQILQIVEGQVAPRA